MKIYLFRSFPDPYRKSMEVYADQLLKGIRSLLNEHEDIVDYLPANVHLTPRCARYWDQYIRYQRLSKTFHGDVNHIIDHSYGHLVNSLPAHRTIVTFHDSTVMKVNTIPYRTRLSLRYSLKAVRKAAMVIADSQISRQDFLYLVDYPEDKVKVVYPGIDYSFKMMQNRDALKKHYNLPGIYILHIGHNLAYMNVEGVFLVLNCLVRRYGINAQLIKVGNRFTATQERLLDRLDLRKRVIHFGRVPFHDLPVIYNCADVLLYPVLYTGFGLPPLEAMACGTPVVCSNRGSLPEIVGDAALMADPEDHQQLAMHVMSLLTDETLRDTYRTKGFQQAQCYSWNKTAREVLVIYRKVYEAQGPDVIRQR